MLLVRKEVLRPNAQQKLILGAMGYAATKLWNIGNYEKRNYKELGMEKFPDWYDQKKRLKENFFYKNLPSQTAQDILNRLQQAWKSYFTLCRTKGVRNPKPPRYKQENMDITFLKGAIKREGDRVRLTIPKQLKRYLSEEYGADATYLYLKTKRFSDICIRELQIKFTGNTYTILAVYEVETPELLPDNGHGLSIDLGIKNTFTCYDSEGKGFIIRGFLPATHYYDKKIARLQAVSDGEQAKQGIRYPKKTRQVKRLYGKKKNSVDDFVHKATRYLADYCREQGITKVIIGDLTHIREGRDIGRSNQQLHALPYRQIYQKLEYKLRLYGVELIRQKESYSSQCSPYSCEVSKKYAKKQNRVFRGLYRENGEVYNADVVGAYNISRLYNQKSGRNINKPNVSGLSSPQKVAV